MAKGDFKLKGMKKFVKNLQNEVSQMRGRTHRGLIEAAIVLQREAEPETPIDLGNLRASWFIVSYRRGNQAKTGTFKGPDSGKMSSQHGSAIGAAQATAAQAGSKKSPVVVFGYSAGYAVFVHENVGASFKRPGARARWLFAAMQRAKSRMLQKIRKHASF